MKLMFVELAHVDGEDFATWATTGAAPAHEAIDRLIRALVRTRATMDPAFPQTPMLCLNDQKSGDAPGWQWTTAGEGGLVLNLFHRDRGWLCFPVSDEDRFQQDLANVIAQRNALRSGGTLRS